MTSPHPVGKAAASLTLAVFALLATPVAQAELKCEETLAARACANNAPRSYEYSPGKFMDVAAPVITGFDSPCWSWSRQFQCVETNPELSCASGSDFNTVKETCSLTAAAITSTVKINALTYITDATYTYRCQFGSFSTEQSLPAGKDCSVLNTTVTDTATASAAAAGATPSSGWGEPPTTAPLDSSVVTDQQQVAEYVCYAPPQTSCTDVCYEQVVDEATGTIEQKEVACTAPISNCAEVTDSCEANVTVGADGQPVGSVTVGPDGRCIKSNTTAMCQNGPIPRCLAQENCTLQSTAPTSLQPNGVAMGQEQTYICTNTVTSCAQVSTVSNCVHVGAWGWDKMQLKSEMGTGLGKFNQALAKTDAIQKGVNQEDPFIFSGQDRRCNYKVGGFMNTLIIAVIVIAAAYMTAGASLTYTTTVMGQAVTATVTTTQLAGAAVAASALSESGDSTTFGSDCCKDYMIQGSDKWYRASKCTEDEVKLAVARRKNMYHYLGEYCSKRGGFPVKECKQMTKVYCTFDDMLALTVNEQGRQQLDSIAQADATLTQSTVPQATKLYGPEITNPPQYASMNNGQWNLVTTFNKSQIWQWQYPGYCRTPEKQKAAYDLWLADYQKAADTTGIEPGTMTAAQAEDILQRTLAVPSFQECAESQGMTVFLTCAKADDSCDVNRLPAGPYGVETDVSGTIVSQADVNWRSQQLQSLHLPGDYGVTSVMPTDATYAAVSSSVSPFITATGSCHADGECLYSFAVTDKTANGGMGAHKRIKEVIQFPLYTLEQNASWPTINYLSADGTLDQTAYQNDPNRTLGTPVVINTQRFLFHPNSLSTQQSGNLHSHVLLDWGWDRQSQDPQDLDQFDPILVPTSLPPATEGFYPYGSLTDNRKHFYISGGCDPNSRWCKYTVEADILVPRHPWGDAQNPRCWGFTVEQLAALDFDKMDLSRWIASLNLDSATNGLSADAAKKLTDQSVAAAQTFYGAFKDGAPIASPVAGQLALVTNTDVLPMLSSNEEGTYVLRAALPTNWPQYFDNGQANNNPVTNVWVDWGDGSPKEPMLKASDRGYSGTHDYGNKPVGRYGITVTLDTALNGPQTLTAAVSITPDDGQMPTAPELSFDKQGTSGQSQTTYTPSDMPNGSSQSSAGLQTLSPGTVEQFNQQGNNLLIR